MCLLLQRDCALLMALVVQFPTDLLTNLSIVLRWTHLVSGIAWVGLGYFLVLVGMPWQSTLEPGLKASAAPPLLRRALWWQRWSSIVAVFVGLWLWMMQVGADRRASEVAHSPAVWSFFAIWTLAYVVYMGVLMSPAKVLHKGPVLAVITIVLIAVASHLFLRINSNGWETNRLLAIGIGGGIGWFMMFNLWGLIWRFQKRLLTWTESGEMPAKGAHMAEVAALASKTNAWLSLPMLFFMAVASHYPMFGMMS